MIFVVDVLMRFLLLFGVSSFLGLVGAYVDYESCAVTTAEVEDDFSPAYKDQLFYDAVGSAPKKPNPVFVTYLEDIGGRLTLEQMHDGAVADLLLAVRNENMWDENKVLRRKLISLLNTAGSYARKHGSLQQIRQVDDLVYDAFGLWPAGPDKASVAHLISDINRFEQKQQALERKELAREQEEQEKEAEKKRKEAAVQEEQAAKDVERQERAVNRDDHKKSKPTKYRSSRPKKIDEEKETKVVKSHPIDRPVLRGRKKAVAASVVVEDDVPGVKPPIDPGPQLLPAYGFTPEELPAAEKPCEDQNTVAHVESGKTKGSVCV